MQLTHSFVADYANVSREGKLNILGIFSIIGSPRFPMVHHSMQLILRFEAHSSESGSTKNVKIELVDADGNRVFEFGGPFSVPPPRKPGEPAVMDHILTLYQIPFPKPGSYAFNILVNDEHKGGIPLTLQQIQTDAE
jgi:hypothetical protein